MDGPCLVIAGPGSGKTKCIVERVFNLIKNGTPADRILVITFTREAAGEMEMRYIKDRGILGVRFSTFHSLFYHILSDRYGSEKIAPKTQKEKENFYDKLGKSVKELFSKEPAALKKWRDCFSYFLVDEYQDINEEQFEILMLLAGDKKNIYAVGDDDQSIYSFRGASPKLMLSFTDYFPDAVIIKLLNNYRSTKRIVEASKHLIANNSMRYEKNISAYSKSYGSLYVCKMGDDVTEAEFILSKIKSILDSSKEKTVGVLFRNRYQGAIIKELLLMEQIPFYTGEKLPDMRSGFVFKDICAMLSLSYERGNAEDELRAKNAFGADYINHLNILKRISPYAGVNYLLKGAGYLSYLHRLSQGNALYEKELLRNADRVKSRFLSIKDKNVFFEMTDDCDERETPRTDSRVGIYTFHGSKGLEFDHVFIPDVNEGIMPSLKSGEDALEEERRMFYVALTRAKKSLTLITVDRRNNKKMYPSRFLGEMQNDEDIKDY